MNIKVNVGQKFNNTMKEGKTMELADSITRLIYAVLDHAENFGKSQPTRQELIDMMQERSPWKGGYDKEWLENIVENAMDHWYKIENNT